MAYMYFYIAVIAHIHTCKLTHLLPSIDITVFVLSGIINYKDRVEQIV